MSLFPLPHETIEGVGQMLRQGQATCVQVLERCLDRIEEWEPRLKAWVLVDREGAIEQAQALDRELARGECRGPLHGIPIGIKDIIDVAGLPTAAGFPPWRSHVAQRDASVVAALRMGGAVILGKTVTTQFAWIDPPPTRNPWNLSRTPGGSSSGSATAVAVGMCLGALGSQTGGSIIRPASYCGVAGLKPTFSGRADGVFPLAPSLDHPGPIARSVRDLGLLFRELLRSGVATEAEVQSPSEVDAACNSLFKVPSTPVRLARFRGEFEARIDRTALEVCDRAMSILAEKGALVTEVELPFDFDEVTHHHRLIMAAEAAAVHSSVFAQAPESYQPRIRSLVEEGQTITAVQYILAREHQDRLRTSMSEASENIDAFVLPATLGPAPDADTTGNPALNAPWSYVGSPTLCFPLGLTHEELPLGIQLVGPRWFTRMT